MNDALNDGIIKCLAVNTNTGWPLGSDSFISKLETVLGRRLRSHPHGWSKGRQRAKEQKGGQ